MGFLYSCSGPEGKDHNGIAAIPDRSVDSSYHKKDFDSLIVSLDKDFDGNLEFTKALMSDTNFREIYLHSSSYFDDMLQFLSKKRSLYQGEKSGMLACLCVWSMQNLSIAEYVKLCNTLVDLYEDKVITEGPLHEAILPNFGDSWIIPHNYSDPRVRALLQRIHDREGVSPELKKKVENVLLGKFN
jgi:hypothetical protein